MEENSNQTNVKIAQRPDGRYTILDATSGTLIDDAQGYGFQTREKAEKYAAVNGWIVINPSISSVTIPMIKRNVIITLNSSRYVICDATTKSVIENAQGYGFSTFEKAENFAVSHGWIVDNKSEKPTSDPLF